MRKGTLMGGLSAIAIAVAIIIASPANAQQYYGNDWYGRGMMGPGMMGPGMMGPGMMGPGMMGPGMMGSGMMGPGMMGPGMMGPGMMGQGMMMGPGMMGMGPGYMGCPWCGPGMMGWGPQQPANLNLSATDVKTYLERWVAMAGNPRIKVGNVTEKDANTITADIVTTEKDALVQRFNVDRRSGFWQPVQ